MKSKQEVISMQSIKKSAPISDTSSIENDNDRHMIWKDGVGEINDTDSNWKTLLHILKLLDDPNFDPNSIIETSCGEKVTIFYWAAQRGHIELIKKLLNHKDFNHRPEFIGNSFQYSKEKSLMQIACELNAPKEIIIALIKDDRINIGPWENDSGKIVDLHNYHKDLRDLVFSIYPPVYLIGRVGLGGRALNSSDGEEYYSSEEYESEDEEVKEQRTSQLVLNLTGQENIANEPIDSSDGNTSESEGYESEYDFHVDIKMNEFSKLLCEKLNDPRYDLNSILQNFNGVEGYFRWIAKEGTVEALEPLLKHKDFNPTPKANGKAKSLLEIAHKIDSYIVMKLLEDSRINPNVTFKTRSGKEETILHWACRTNSRNMIRLLLSRKDTELNPKGKSGFTPFYLACCKDMRTVKLLLDHPGIIINKEKESDCNPLEAACSTGNFPVVKLLLECSSFKPKEALELAAKYEEYNIFAYFLQHKRIPFSKEITPILMKVLEMLLHNGNSQICFENVHSTFQPQVILEKLLGATHLKPKLKKTMQELLWKIIEKRRAQNRPIYRACQKIVETFSQDPKKVAYEYAKKHYADSLDEQEKEMRALHYLHQIGKISLREKTGEENLDNAIAYFKMLEGLPPEVRDLILEKKLGTGRDFPRAIVREETLVIAHGLLKATFSELD
jgi:ankyrin repeat protein